MNEQNKTSFFQNPELEFLDVCIQFFYRKDKIAESPPLWPTICA
jgi:hypothetical protein